MNERGKRKGERRVGGGEGGRDDMYGVRVILMMIRGRCVRVQASSRLDWLEFEERKEAQEEDSKVP